MNVPLTMETALKRVLTLLGRSTVDAMLATLLPMMACPAMVCRSMDFII